MRSPCPDPDWLPPPWTAFAVSLIALVGTLVGIFIGLSAKELLALVTLFGIAWSRVAFRRSGSAPLDPNGDAPDPETLVEGLMKELPHAETTRSKPGAVPVGEERGQT
jgi:hypothetical protein